ncbi:Putative O-antigen transporter [Mixta intestinalis]|uniref:O-antigen transporter n=2 Tax=Mixta intestinalis TaxID=1615494 RepID=A0A6P1PZY7_9GAMM|nr:Putative O-antigen transporter [Mixta intestinalis]
MAIVKVLTLGFPLLIIPLLINNMGLVKYGHYAVLFATANIIATFINYGFDYTASRDLARTHIPEERNKLFSVFLFCKIIIFIIILPPGIIIAILKSYPFWDIFSVLVYSISQVLIPIYVFQGLKKMEYLIFNTLFLNVTYLFVLLLFSFLGISLSGGKAFFIYGLITLLASFCMFFYIRKAFSIKITPVKITQVKEKYLDGLAIFISRISSAGLSQVNLIVLAHTLTPSALGYYAVGDKLIRAANSIFFAFQQATYPYFCQKKQMKKFNQLLVLLIISSLLAVLVIILSSDFIATILLQNAEDGSIFVLISWALVPMAISGMIGVNYLLANDMNIVFSTLLFLGALLNLSLLYILSSLFSWYGAVNTLIITETFLAMTMIVIYLYKEYFLDEKI